MEDKLVKIYPWLPELLADVRDELSTLCKHEQDRAPSREKELELLEAKAQGWAQSLANPDLARAVRAAIENEWAAALARCEELRSQLNQETSRQQLMEQHINPSEILDRLRRLSDVLATNNPTMGNLELSLHIDRISCYRDGSVSMRSCKLGALADVVSMLSDSAATPCADADHVANDTRQATRRRRGRLRIEDPENEKCDLRALADFAADPNRFAGLEDRWFWTDTFQIEARKSWAREHAADVAARRHCGLTEAKLAEEFRKTIPTIRAALKHAARDDDSLQQLPKKMPRPRWHEDFADEVASLKAATGMSTLQLAEHFCRSDTTIRKALDHAAKTAEEMDSQPDGHVRA